MNTSRFSFLTAAVLVLLAASMRLVPHPWNFAPVAAAGLFAGTYLGARYAFIVPIAAVFLSDLVIGFYGLPVLLAVYASFALAGGIGLLIRRHKNVETVIGGSLLASITFFLITNFAVWKFTPYYDPGFAGLLESYTLAVPFFRNTLIGDLFFTGAFFGSYEVVRMLVHKREHKFATSQR